MVVEGPWEDVYEIVHHNMPTAMGITDVPAQLGAAFMAGQEMPPVYQQLSSKRFLEAVSVHPAR